MKYNKPINRHPQFFSKLNKKPSDKAKKWHVTQINVYKNLLLTYAT